MDVTSKLLKVFHVEKQIRGLSSRLTAAERFLAQQNKELDAIAAKRAALEGTYKTHLGASKGNEGEMARLTARMDAIKKQMDSAQTNKEYKAFLTEYNTLKAEADRFETAATEGLMKVDEVKKQLAELDAAKADREKVKAVAQAERDQREVEIKGRMDELKAQRVTLLAEVPADALEIFNQLLRTKGDEAMAPLEEQDRKRLEYTCGSCMMNVRIDAVTGLLSNGKLTLCTSCGSILYLEKETAEALTAGKK